MPLRRLTVNRTYYLLVASTIVQEPVNLVPILEYLSPVNLTADRKIFGIGSVQEQRIVGIAVGTDFQTSLPSAVFLIWEPFHCCRVTATVAIQYHV